MLVPSLPGYFLLDLSSQSDPKRWSQHTEATVPHLDLISFGSLTFKSKSLSLARGVPEKPGHRARPHFCSLLLPFGHLASMAALMLFLLSGCPSPHPHPPLHPSLTLLFSPEVPPVENGLSLGPGVECGNGGHSGGGGGGWGGGRWSKMSSFRESKKEHSSSPSNPGTP